MDNDAYYYLLSLLPLCYYVTRLYRASFGCRSHGLRLPPGPWQLPVIGSLHHLFRALPHRALRDLSRRHGPLMFLKFGENPVIIASTAQAAKEIMKTHDSVFCTRPLSSSVKVTSKNGMGIVFAPYGDHWRQMRKICFVELLSAKRVGSCRPVREEEAIRLIRSVSSASESDGEQLVNLSKLVAAYVTDTAVHTIMGRRFKENDTFLRYLDDAVRLVDGFTLPDLFPSSRLARALSGALRQAEVLGESLMAFMGSVIGEHLVTRNSSDEPHQDGLIDVLMRIQGEGDLQFPLTMSSIKAVIWDLLSGGTEIATTTLQWAMAELMRNPSVMSRAQAEVRAAFMGQMKASEDGLSELSYLQCIVKETLRLHTTPGPLLIPRESRDDCKILGYDVPKGTTVIVNAWAICRDPKCWDEPEAFVPERFLGSTRDYKGNNFEFIPFGAGRRSCPGMLFGIANMQLALASLLFYFDWGLPDGVLPAELDMGETMGVTARRKMDLWLRPALRVPLP
ncbi:hypothetical protein QYE76_048276 [Lolium multiflorum]|uniref:Cytochrome P450 n=1 Tax=Lolium multiflorum TaxID=4521 RepID=A0AAD8VEK0_LOLMU|nr:hypothetical protein QYE76_048276 [Lolium multiflorum]